MMKVQQIEANEVLHDQKLHQFEPKIGLVQTYFLHASLEHLGFMVVVPITSLDLAEVGYQTKKQRWTQEQDKLLIQLTKKSENNWEQISTYFSHRNAKMCYNRFKRLSFDKQRSWKIEDDTKISQLIQEYGHDWKKIKTHFPYKTAKQLKDHYQSYLKPGLDLSKWDLTSDLKLVRLLSIYGCDWVQLAKRMPEKSYTHIKNRYYCRISKIVIKKLQEICQKKNLQ